MNDEFQAGATQFFQEHLRAYVIAQNEGLDTTDTATIHHTAVLEDASLPDAGWERDAAVAANALWQGSIEDFEAVWGRAAPASMVHFEDATRGASPWTTFHEYRQNAGHLINPAASENLFEMLTLHDQRTGVGLALVGAFTGSALLGSLGNGDSYHLDVLPVAGSNVVSCWDHEVGTFSDAFAKCFEDLVFVSALMQASHKQQVSAETTSAALRSLHGRVAPRWPFAAAEDHDPTFVPFQVQGPEAKVAVYHARNAWIIATLLGDASAEDIAAEFVAPLNAPLTEEAQAKRLHEAQTHADLAIHALWKAYLLEEPVLGSYLELCQGHASRLARDAARLVVELQNGRTALGKIEDFPKRMQEVRDLNLSAV